MTPNELAEALAEIFADFAANQEPLGAEFEAVWDANVDRLYQS